MFNKILIANRGEIACRIIKTAKKMGIQTVAIYSSADKDSVHVQMADEAYWIGEAPARDSYLNSENILQAALTAGAEAIHPGYGFLSENPSFASACANNHLVFIGPSIAAMEAMASKQLAKQQLEKTAVPLVPGYHDALQSEEALAEEAQKLGFPLLLKPANGGGGKGMHVVYQHKDFLKILASAKRESLASFSDDTIILEKLLIKPRHVEIQIMADNFGNVVHLFERDCSIQRRHQKIIEEAPAPNLSSDLREQLAKAACTVARVIDYRGAGTVEFLVSEEGHFYFMEMNTRLQVEHPVTEMITGLDLVAWQIHIAANHPLPLAQEAIQTKGHAIECRVYAEDPHQDFMPSVGKLNFYKEPKGEGIRVDSGVHKASTISQYYDPMIAKLIAHGATREEALMRLKQALTQFMIGGVKSNLAFLEAIVDVPSFRNAHYHIDFLKEETLALSPKLPASAALLVAGHHYLSVVKHMQDPLKKASFAWQMQLSSHWYYTCLIADEKVSFTIYPEDEHAFRLSVGDKPYNLSISQEQEKLVVSDALQRYWAYVENSPEGQHFFTEEGQFEAQELQDFGGNLSDQPHGAHLKAPMSATIVALLKNPGDIIQKNEPLMILEAMKMEHTIHAPEDGRLAEYFYPVGAQVQEGTELLRLEEEAP